jgi:hypothetical protein
MAMTMLDEAFIAPRHVLRSHGVRTLSFVTGDDVRDWAFFEGSAILDPYGNDYEHRDIERKDVHALRLLWPNRMGLRSRRMFGKTADEAGIPWYEYRYIETERAKAVPLIAFACVATQNQFALLRRRVVSNRHAPVIKLPADASEDDHLALLGLLNSSTACFWMKQIFYDKGGGGISEGVKAEAWERFYEHDGTKLKQFPLPPDRPLALGRQLDDLARQLSATLPAAVVSRGVPTAAGLAAAREAADALLGRMIALQEELDWECYRLYGLIDDAPRCSKPPAIKLGQRAFEIVLARQMAAGEEETTWFTRHSSTPMTQIPSDWPEEYRKIVQRRIEIVESDKNVALIERPEYKRRWNTEPWDEQQTRALKEWLLDRLESYFDIDGRLNDRKEITARGDLREPRLTSVAKVADLAKQDQDFMQVAELCAGRMDFDVAALVGELVAAESVPCLPILRYKPSGIDKRTAWERTWALQREEDRINGVFE